MSEALTDQTISEGIHELQRLETDIHNKALQILALVERTDKLSKRIFDTCGNSFVCDDQAWLLDATAYSGKLHYTTRRLRADGSITIVRPHATLPIEDDAQ